MEAGDCPAALPGYPSRKRRRGMVFNAQYREPEAYHATFIPERMPRCDLEALGMAQAEERVGTFREFKINPAAHRRNRLHLPAADGNRSIPVCIVRIPGRNFYAPCDLFGTPEELKELVDAARNGAAGHHGLGAFPCRAQRLEGLAVLRRPDAVFHPDRAATSAWGLFQWQAKSCVSSSQTAAIGWKITLRRIPLRWRDQYVVLGPRTGKSLYLIPGLFWLLRLGGLELPYHGQ